MSRHGSPRTGVRVVWPRQGMLEACVTLYSACPLAPLRRHNGSLRARCSSSTPSTKSSRSIASCGLYDPCSLRMKIIALGTPAAANTAASCPAPTRHALGGQAEPSRQFEQTRDPTFVQARRRRLSAVKLEPYLALVGRRRALRVEQLVELLQRLAALTAHFKAERQFARDARHRIRTRIGRHDAECEHQIPAPFEPLGPMLVQAMHQLGCCQHGVATQPARPRPPVSGLAATHDMLVANVPSDTRHDCGGPLVRDQHRPLFDVQLEIDGRAVDVEEALTAAHALDLHPRTRHRFGKRARIAAMTQIEIFAVELAKQRAGARVGLAEPRALLSAQAEHPDRPGRLSSLAPEVDQAPQDGDDAGESV